MVTLSRLNQVGQSLKERSLKKFGMSLLVLAFLLRNQRRWMFCEVKYFSFIFASDIKNIVAIE
jgi:hypothetical protein